MFEFTGHSTCSSGPFATTTPERKARTIEGNLFDHAKVLDQTPVKTELDDYLELYKIVDKAATRSIRHVCAVKALFSIAQEKYVNFWDPAIATVGINVRIIEKGFDF